MEIKLYNCLGHSSSDTHNLAPYDRLYRYAMDNWIYGGNIVGNLEIIDPFAVFFNRILALDVRMRGVIVENLA